MARGSGANWVNAAVEADTRLLKDVDCWVPESDLLKTKLWLAWV